MHDLTFKDLLDLMILITNLFAIFMAYLKIEIRLVKIEEKLKFTDYLEKRENGHK